MPDKTVFNDASHALFRPPDYDNYATSAGCCRRFFGIGLPPILVNKCLKNRLFSVGI